MSENARRIVLRPLVADDLEMHVEYLDEKASPEVSDRYLAAVNSAFEQVARMPDIGAPRDYLNPRVGNLRMWPVPQFRNYLIFNSTTIEAVEIIRILHGAQDVEVFIAEES